MCFYKIQQWVCLRRLTVPSTGFDVDIQPTVPEKLCRKTWESRYRLESCRPGFGCGERPDSIITRRWFGLCGPCMEIANRLYQGHRRDIIQQNRVYLPANLECRFALARDMVSHEVAERPPFEFWIEFGRQDGGGLELKDFDYKWALCKAISGDVLLGDGQCVRDFWDEESRNYTLTEDQYVEKEHAAREAMHEAVDSGDDDEVDSNEPSMHGFQQHLGFDVDPGI